MTESSGTPRPMAMPTTLIEAIAAAMDSQRMPPSWASASGVDGDFTISETCEDGTSEDIAAEAAMNHVVERHRRLRREVGIVAQPRQQLVEDGARDRRDIGLDGLFQRQPHDLLQLVRRPALRQLHRDLVAEGGEEARVEAAHAAGRRDGAGDEAQALER